jgi:endonuclease-3
MTLKRCAASRFDAREIDGVYNPATVGESSTGPRGAAPVEEAISRLRSEYPEARTELVWHTPLDLLVATILSAQCTDVRVNKVTPGLFERYRTAGDYAGVEQETLEEEIRSTGFYRNKARSIQGMARGLLENHGGNVPRSLDELVKLPGVGRKTANVVLGDAFGEPEGVVVDTHVKRLSRRLGLTEKDDPEKVERDLIHIVPEAEWAAFSHLLIFHGRNVCKARKPDCPACVLNDICPSSTV